MDQNLTVKDASRSVPRFLPQHSTVEKRTASHVLKSIVLCKTLKSKRIETAVHYYKSKVEKYHEIYHSKYRLHMPNNNNVLSLTTIFAKDNFNVP